MAGNAAVVKSSFEHERFDHPCRAWLVVMIAALFFFYEFIQMNMFNAISQSLMTAFNIDATQLGTMSSYYFIANVIFLFVAGMLLDRYSTKKIILSTLLICIIGTVFFALSTSIAMATFARFFTGIGSAFCFLSCIRLASRWFPTRHMALIIGCIVTMAMIGGTVAQAPLTILVEMFQWRKALLIDAALGIFVFLLIYFVVYDYPPNLSEEEKNAHQELQELGYWKSMRMAFLRLNNWLGGLYTCLMNLPVVLLGGLWGNLYLIKVHQFTAMQASIVSSMLFIGTIVGSPLSGWFSDKLGLRRLPMRMGALIALGLVATTIMMTQLDYQKMIIMFFIIGFVTSTQIIGYPFVAESSPRIITAMSVSVVNISAQAGIALFQPLFGYFMDLHAQILHEAISYYSAGDFVWPMLIFPIGMILALLITFILKETYGKSLEQRELEQNTGL